MKKHILTAAIAAVLVFAPLAGAEATMHDSTAAPPQDFLGAVAYEARHFMLHMQFTFQALVLLFQEPALAKELLGSNALCASNYGGIQTPITNLLFGGVYSSIATFFTVIAVVAYALLRLGLLFVLMLARALRPPTRRPAA